MIHQLICPIDDKDQSLSRPQRLSGFGEQLLLQFPHQASVCEEAGVRGREARQAATQLANLEVHTCKCWGGDSALPVFDADGYRGV